MNKIRKISLLAGFIFLLSAINLSTQAQSTEEMNSLLTRTWYSQKVGNPDGSDLFPTKNPEEVTFSDDGKMTITQQHSMMGEIVTDATWEYNAAKKIIELEMKMGDQAESIEVSIQEIDTKNMVLLFPHKLTVYATTPPEKSPEPKKTEAISEDSTPIASATASTIQLENWSGTYPFNEAMLITLDDKVEKYPSKGEIILYKEGDKKIIKKIENGYTDLYEVSDVFIIVDEKHYGINTDVPEIAGEFVFRGDGSLYYYFDSNQSSVDYYMK